MIRSYVLLKVTAVKAFNIFRRYLFNSALSVVGLYLMFGVVFFGGRAVAPDAVSESIESIIVGYFLFTMSIIAFQKTSSDMNREAQWGTLEQLYMSPYGIGRVVAAKSLVNIFGSLLLGTTMLVMMLATTGRPFDVHLLTVAFVGLVTVAAPIGIGFVIGGLALLYKRVSRAGSLVQFALLGLIATPIDVHPAVKWLPMTLGSHVLQQSVREGMTLFEFPPTTIAILVVSSFTYLALGYLALHRLQYVARVRGVLGHY